MAKVARGKALVAKLRAQAGVRDPEALAAWLGRFKKARKSGMGVAAAKKAADGKGSKSDSPKSTSDNRKKGFTEFRRTGHEDAIFHSIGDEKKAGFEEKRVAKKRQQALDAIPSDADIRRQVEEQAKRLNMPPAMKEKMLKRRLADAKKRRKAAMNLK